MEALQGKNPSLHDPSWVVQVFDHSYCAYLCNIAVYSCEKSIYEESTDYYSYAFFSRYY